MCCGGLNVISALFLVADMVSDCLNVWDYHNKAYENNDNRTNFLDPRFYKILIDGEWIGVQESYYFIFSLSAMLLPVLVATVCLLFYLLYVYFMEKRQFFIRRFCNGECGKVFGTIAASLLMPFTFILCLILSIVVIFLSWIVSPILHILFAFFIAFGNKPAGNSESKLKGLEWKRFATLMMFLSIVETMFEAVPEAILGLCLCSFQLKSNEEDESRLLFLWSAFPYQVISLFFSFCTVVKTIGTVAYTTTNDFDNSIFGMVNTLKDQYKKKHQKVKGKKDLEIEKLKGDIKHLETLIEVKQKSIDIYNSFNAVLEISGFETGNENERGEHLNDMGLPLEILFGGKKKASYPDNSCVLTDIGLPESVRFMKKLYGKKYNDSPLQMNCSIYMAESKISSPSPSTSTFSSVTPLPSSEEILDVEHTQLLNEELKSTKMKGLNKGKTVFSFGCWRKSSNNSSQLDNSDFEMFEQNNEEVSGEDAIVSEQSSETPPPSYPNTPTILPDSEISCIESSEQRQKDEYIKQEI